ncbi:MAG: DUF1566 domain-containing protein [Thiocapsa sp.]|uniref:Lcl domain-containing protein n=1 Tax=Thiocapsa sp. TaxID=2024551 RepID=UPI001BCD157A|nr:DUF1566 domain-containing protein [Thiocapsa sp.]QVL49251.1 MAG: DUF1566 domain-containing protein [Thiocapsa sp.]
MAELIRGPRVLVAAVLIGCAVWGQIQAAEPVCSLDVDGNGVIEATKDGTLLIRHSFGFGGDALISGAVGTGATRTTASDITAWLNRYECADMLDVDADGRRDGLTDGLLQRRYLAGYQGSALIDGAVAEGAARATAAAIESHLSFYQNLDASIRIQPPQIAGGGYLLSGVTARLSLAVDYTGTGILAHELIDGPAGMTIDGRSGLLTWVPPVAAEGTEVQVQVQVSDGEISDSLGFSLAVAAPQPIATVVDGDTVTVVEPGTLQGLALTLPAQVSPLTRARGVQAVAGMADVGVSVIPEAEAPPMPAEVIRVSDFFRTTPLVAEDGEIRITLPTVEPPAGYSPYDLSLYIYTDGVTDVDGPIWVRIRRHIEIDQDGNRTVELHGIGKPSFIGVPVDALEQSKRVPEELKATPERDCTTRTIEVGGRTLDSECCNEEECVLGLCWQIDEDPVCRVDTDDDGDFNDEAFAVSILDFSKNNWDWSASTRQPYIHELLQWLYTATTWFDESDFDYDAAFECVVEECVIDKKKCAGYVSSDENYGTLHLSKSNYTEAFMQGTAVHEFFHHAQSRTRIVGKDNMLREVGVVKGSWLLEGTARWFEDELYDSLDTYTFKEYQPHPRILEKGFAAPHSKNKKSDATWAYARFALWKLIDLECQVSERGDGWRSLLNGDFSGDDTTGIVNLGQRIAGWNCDFGTGTGAANKSTLGAALARYQDATIRLDDIEKLDGGPEPSFQFDRDVPRLVPDSDRSNFVSGSIPAAGASSFVLAGGASIPAGKQAVARITSDDAPVWMTLVSPDSAFIAQPGVAVHETPAGWVGTSGAVDYPYARSPSRLPEVYVHLVNPSLDADIRVTLSVAYEPIPGAIGPVEVTPSSGSWSSSPQALDLHSDGAEALYYTMVNTYDGSTPPDPRTPTPSDNDNDRDYDGPDDTFEYYGRCGTLKRTKLRFVGCDQDTCGPASGVYAYQMDLRGAPCPVEGAEPLNDTGIDWCADGTRNFLACPVAGYPWQDAQDGRDAHQHDDSDGHAGFSFTKLDANGNALSASATSWRCVRDNVTGLVWEVKTDDGGLRDKDWRYTWYNPDPGTNGGDAGTQDGGSCSGSACDTHAFVQAVNAAGLCGARDWRLPSVDELLSIISNDRINPAIDTGYFPYTVSNGFWSSSPIAGYSDRAWPVNFGYGNVGHYEKSYALYVRLVRAGQ